MVLGLYEESSMAVSYHVKLQMHYSFLIKIFCVCLFVAILTGCAAGKLFMAGYQPPQTIADLLREQNELAGQLGAKGGKIKPNLINEKPAEADFKERSNEDITLSGYKGIAPVRTSRNSFTVPNMQGVRNSYQARFTHKSIHDYASQLAMNLIKNANGLSPHASIAVTSFVKLDYSLQNTTVLGNQLAEYSILELQQFGLNIVDHKLMPAIEVSSKGDLIFARDIRELASKQVMDHVLAATMIERSDGVFINARIMSLHTNRVVASGSVLIPSFIIEQLQPQLASY